MKRISPVILMAAAVIFILAGVFYFSFSFLSEKSNKVQPLSFYTARHDPVAREILKELEQAGNYRHTEKPAPLLDRLLRSADRDTLITVFVQGGFLSEDAWGRYFYSEKKLRGFSSTHLRVMRKKIGVMGNQKQHHLFHEVLDEMSARAPGGSSDLELYVDAYKRYAAGKLKADIFTDMLGNADPVTTLALLKRLDFLTGKASVNGAKIRELAPHIFYRLMQNLSRDFSVNGRLIGELCVVYVRPGGERDDRRSAMVMTLLSNELRKKPDGKKSAILARMLRKADDDIAGLFLFNIGYVNQNAGKTSSYHPSALSHLTGEVRSEIARCLRSGLIMTPFEKKAIKDLDLEKQGG